MELALLKDSWQRLDHRIRDNVSFNEKLIDSIVSSRVTTTVDSIRRLYTFFYLVLTVEMIAFLAILFGNPFDFEYKIQFLPYALLLVGVALTFLNLIHLGRSINRLSPCNAIGHYLKSIVDVYERNKRMEKWFGIMFLTLGALVPLSFLPQKIERMGHWSALGDTAIMIAVTLAIYIAAFRLGVFRNRYREKLERELKEWKELRGLVEEMK